MKMAKINCPICQEGRPFPFETQNKGKDFRFHVYNHLKVDIGFWEHRLQYLKQVDVKITENPTKANPVKKVVDGKGYECDLCPYKKRKNVIRGGSEYHAKKSMICHLATVHHELRTLLERDERFNEEFISKIFQDVENPKSKIQEPLNSSSETGKQKSKTANSSPTIQKYMQIAAETGNLKDLKNWFKNQINSKSTDVFGRSFLQLASLKGHFETVEYLIDHGAEPNVIDSHEQTPLHDAARGGHFEIIKFLVTNGAKIDVKDDAGSTPLHHAAQSRNVEIGKFLIENGANIDAKDKDGCTPLHSATHGGHLETLKLLVEKGAKIDITNHDNETPFYIANRENLKKMAKYLLEKKREVENQKPKETFSTKDPCIICLEPRNAIFVLNPCGHSSLCELCSYNLTEQRHAKCPTCRKPVQNYIKMFFQVGPADVDDVEINEKI